MELPALPVRLNDMGIFRRNRSRRRREVAEAGGDVAGEAVIGAAEAVTSGALHAVGAGLGRILSAIAHALT
ncbi:hypothetical protein Ntsu_24210 [Nocardia sp. IFM 10818]